MIIYYPVFLDLRGRSCVVIGGGAVALRKTNDLRACGAKLSVVSPRVVAGLKKLAGRRAIRWRKGTFRPSDLAGADLAVAATDNASVNERAAREARRRRIWINVVDQPALCSFIVPAVVRRGKLTLAVSTAGVSPALAKWIREDLARRYGPEWKQALAGMEQWRGKVRSRVGGVRQRKKLFEEALGAYVRTLRKAIR